MYFVAEVVAIGVLSYQASKYLHSVKGETGLVLLTRVTDHEI
jgi:hypothetical protein